MSLQRWQPRKFTFDDAAHLWRRAGFGASRKTIEETVALGPDKAIDRLVDGPADDAAAKDLEFIYRSVIGAEDEDGARGWILLRMLRSEHPVREKIALFWHSHFATSNAKIRDLRWMTRQYRLFLNHGLGKFPVLLDAVAKDPAMIRWLDNETNRKGHANENYAREVLELFTLGEGNYTEKDVTEAARAFTGWHLLRGKFHFSTTLHDAGEKTVLGQTGAFGGEDIQRIALEQPSCGRFLARKLLQFYVHPEPDPATVNDLGDAMRADGYDMSATLRRIFQSKLFFSQHARRSIVKGPIDFVIGCANALEIDKFPAKTAVPPLRAMGQDLLAPPNVKGWPGHRSWMNTATWLVRVRTARAIAAAAGDVSSGSGGNIDTQALALLGRSLDEQERNALTGTPAARLQALLCTPEAHLL